MMYLFSQSKYFYIIYLASYGSTTNVCRISCHNISTAAAYWKYNIHNSRIMVFNATFNIISVISWWSVLLVEEIGIPGENHRTAASLWQTLSHTVVSSTLVMNGVLLMRFENKPKSYRGYFSSLFYRHFFSNPF